MIHHLQHIADLVKICELKGLQHVVISPGSRNAPLIDLFYRNGNFHLHSLVDERSAAFYGLGIALATGQAVALLCTSGTAVLNYAPALAEAYYQRVPLIVLTADRPENLIDQQDNQTIRQVNVYQNYIKASIHLHLPVHDRFELEAQHDGINKVINSAVSGIKGPVHINVPIAEPFYIEMPFPSSEIKISAPEKVATASIEGLINAWNSSQKRMIICGEGAKNEVLNKQLSHLTAKAIVLAEPISNVKGVKVIAEVDRLMMNIESNAADELKPDVLISFGGSVVSKRLKQWLQKQKNLKHYRIADEEDQIDTYQNLTALVKGNLTEILEKLETPKVAVDQVFLENWHSIYQHNKTVHELALEGLPYSDITVFKHIMKNLP
ncbi:MAG: 2-succinyl-5-enolpyruvyl-6-hydroxy-3-cyclohexene-1-carboxylic-acid synthase, partial [Prolixibacteraceae bacterium]|nr:2-succinyl-5-enolpyruvyl-6-hydroxy-3-cyclohexene-1-carboxylic-acid synthase [Prolixibacteraceae bacterium]